MSFPVISACRLCSSGFEKVIKELPGAPAQGALSTRCLNTRLLSLHKMQLKNAVAALAFASIGGVNAFFRVNCAKIQVGRIDPIVNPGALAAHYIGVNATFDSLYNSECTSCEVSEDKSAYWTPNLYYQHANGSFEEVPHDGSVIYYLARGQNANDIVSFPKGFQMLSGNKALRAANQSGMTWGSSKYRNRPISDAVSYACLSAKGGPETPNLPADPRVCINGLRAQIHFQTCWNGRDLYKADNSHVAHMTQIDNGVCPPGYPYQFPHLFLETNYAVTKVSNLNDGGRFVFSQGDPTGYGFHGDFQNGWNDDVLKDAIATCLVDGQDDSGTIDDCPALLKHWNPQFSQNCPIRPPQINERATGMIDKLPGCIRVTDGPGAATAADMECPASVPQASISRTVDSTPRPTFNPSIGTEFGNKFNKVVGCGNDSYVNNGFRTLNALSTTLTGMTVEYCQTYCTKRGYQYSGLENGNQCYCDLAINPTAIIANQANFTKGCNIFCPGNRSEICGGAFYMSLYNNTDPAFKPTTDLTKSGIQLTVPVAPFNKTYVGCATEGSGGRALNSSTLINTNMTLAQCAAFAKTKNTAFYGLENFNECYVGNGLASGAKIVDTATDISLSKCRYRCVGNFSQVCGGSGALSVYSNPAYKPVQIVPNVGKYNSKGCVQEPTTGGRALKGGSTTATDMTVEKCIKYCLGKNFRFAGIEYGSQCYCGSQVEAGATTIKCDTSKLMLCPGNKYQFCGAGNLLNLYYASAL
ncbi:WSC-domain-containing protein [Aureobasidium pullulans]|uniref:WSC-domain-containing protein n=1 Tax=Aureobasidium pullulans TaxID=5580 RepID=A0A4S9F5E7_AURPU|nr:WSC-domain-containing protein [Aureobasidium pullulans]